MSASGHDPGAARPAAAGEEVSRGGAEVLKDIALFFAAPFVTLAYIALFPFIGLMLWRRSWRQRTETG